MSACSLSTSFLQVYLSELIAAEDGDEDSAESERFWSLFFSLADLNSKFVAGVFGVKAWATSTPLRLQMVVHVFGAPLSNRHRRRHQKQLLLSETTIKIVLSVRPRRELPRTHLWNQVFSMAGKEGWRKERLRRRDKLKMLFKKSLLTRRMRELIEMIFVKIEEFNNETQRQGIPQTQDQMMMIFRNAINRGTLRTDCKVTQTVTWLHCIG